MLPEATPYCGFSQHFTFKCGPPAVKKNNITERGSERETKGWREVKKAKKARWMEEERKERLRELQ